MKIRERIILGVMCFIIAISSISFQSYAIEIVHADKFKDYRKEYGVDVSKWNGNIDWNSVKKSNVDFAFIRVGNRGYATQGKLIEDDQAKSNLAQANAVGIPVGVYVYSQAITQEEAVEEAQLALKMIKGYEITLPIVMDVEYAGTSSEGEGRLYDAKLTKQEATDICEAFCSTIEEAGFTPMIYANVDMLKNHLLAKELESQYPIWLAHYTGSTTYDGDYAYWQYTSKGQISGIQGNVDLNVRYIQETGKVTGVTISELKKDALTLSWNQLEGADGYEIYRKTGEEDYVNLAEISGNDSCEYLDQNLKTGTTYTYFVKAFTWNGEEKVYAEDSLEVSAKTALGKVEKFAAKSGGYDQVKLTWNRLEGADGYNIRRYDQSTKTYKSIKTISGGTATSYTDTQLNASTKYSYKIYPYHMEGKQKIYGDGSATVSVTTGKPVSGVTTATNLNVRSGPGTSYKSIGKAKKNQTVSVTGSRGNWYRVSITLNGKKQTGYILKSYVKLTSATKVGQVTLSTKASSFYQVKLSWKKVSGASGYEIQRYSASKKAYVTIKTITKGTTTSYTNTDLDAGTTYKYRVRAYKTVSGKKIYGAFSSVKSCKTQKSLAGKVTASNVNVRKGAGNSYKSYGTVKKNTKITVIGRRGEWYRVTVKVKGKTVKGYMSKKYIKI